jgi:hypothetical protein
VSRVRLSLSHSFLEGSPSCWPRLLLALSSNWSMLFMGCVFCFFLLWEVFAFVFVTLRFAL